MILATKAEELVRLMQHEKPSGETHWSCRSMAKRSGSVRLRSSGSGLGAA